MSDEGRTMLAVGIILGAAVMCFLFGIGEDVNRLRRKFHDYKLRKIRESGL